MTPARTLCLLVALSGAALVWLNRVSPDESRLLGLGLLLAGLGLAVRPEGRRARRTAELLAVGMLLLLGGELAVRWQNTIAQRDFSDAFVHFVDDVELRYELKPNTRCSESITNDLGMLDVARQPANPRGALRIACLGDSVGGDCQLPGRNACAALETELGRVRPVEVLNFSVPGYNTLQEARALETKAAAFAPDAVVVLYVINDPYPDLAISHHLPGQLKFEHLLYSGLRQLLARVGLGDPLADDLARLYGDPRAWNVVVRGFERISTFARARSIPVVVAIFPVFLTRPSSLAPIYQRVAAEATRQGLWPIDLSERAYRDVPVSSLLKPSQDSIHPNAHAHELAAAAIARALLDARPGWRQP